MGNQLAAPARVQPGELLASDVPSLVYKDSLGGETSHRHTPPEATRPTQILLATLSAAFKCVPRP